MKSLFVFILGIGLAVGLTFDVGSPNKAQAQEFPSRFTNLRVLPGDITKDELYQTMKLIAKSLGAKCNYCHRTDTRDYASDEIKEKVIARKMMRMVERINGELFTWKDAPEATCFMCHQGRRKPQMVPEHRKSDERALVK